MRAMTLRIGVWILVGATVTCFWVLVMMAIGPRHNISHWLAITIAVPASVLLPRNRPVSYYEVMFLNAAIYGLAGLALEPLFRLLRPSPLRPH